MQNILRKIKDLKVDRCQSNLYVRLKQLLFFCKFYDFFYNNLFQFMQHDNFRNSNRVIFTHRKHLLSELMAFDTVFQ